MTRDLLTEATRHCDAGDLSQAVRALTVRECAMDAARQLLCCPGPCRKVNVCGRDGAGQCPEFSMAVAALRAYAAMRLREAADAAAGELRDYLRARADDEEAYSNGQTCARQAEELRARAEFDDAAVDRAAAALPEVPSCGQPHDFASGYTSSNLPRGGKYAIEWPGCPRCCRLLARAALEAARMAALCSCCGGENALLRAEIARLQAELAEARAVQDALWRSTRTPEELRDAPCSCCGGEIKDGECPTCAGGAYCACGAKVMCSCGRAVVSQHAAPCSMAFRNSTGTGTVQP